MDNFTDYCLHGSDIEVKEPKILSGRFRKDFGDGFYTTRIQSQAERWAIRKGKGTGRVTSYKLNPNYTDLNYKFFTMINDEWLDFVVDCREGKQHAYDLVEGPMADDQIYNFIESYRTGQISREDFMLLIKFRYPTHQLCFCTDKALKHLKFNGSYEVQE